MEKVVGIGIIGSCDVGKSCLTIRFVNGVYFFVGQSEPSPVRHQKVQEINREKVVLDLIEIKDSYQNSPYLEDADDFNCAQGFLLVYSVNSRESFDSLNQIRRDIYEKKGDQLVPIVIIGAKSDEERVVSTEEGQDIASSWGCPFREVSTKTSKQDEIEDCFLEITRLILKSQAIRSSKLKIDNSGNSNPSKCHIQ
jgi:GTPase KRas protein